MQKARSRLDKHLSKAPAATRVKSAADTLATGIKKRLRQETANENSSNAPRDFFSWLIERSKLLWLLLIGVFSTISILLFVHPSSIADWPVPQTYFLLLVSWSLVVYALARLWLSSWHANLAAIVAVVIGFTRLHSLVLPPVFWYWMFGIILVSESVYFWSRKLLVKKKFGDILRPSKAKARRT